MTSWVKEMTMNVLVAHAGRTGPSAEIAGVIGRHLREAGLTVDVRACDEAPYAAGYDAVVLGSTVTSRRWDRSAVDYLRAQAWDLPQRRTWLFQTGSDEDAPRPGDSGHLPRAVRHLIEETGLRYPVFFSPRADRRPPTRWRTRSTATGARLRDPAWDRVGHWADRIARTLQALEAQARDNHPSIPRPELVGMARP